MNKFSRRSEEKELLDAEHIPRDELYLNLRELHKINSLLGGYDVFKKTLPQFLKPGKKLRVLDLGSGGGDTLKFIARHFGEKHELELTGVDLKTDCVNFAKENCKSLNINFIQADCRTVLEENPGRYDVIIASLFCHHFPDRELAEILKLAAKSAVKGLIINDIHRHLLAYYGIKYLTAAFSSSHLVKNDACLSVLRAFSRQDWERICAAAGLKNYRLNWIWAFRWALIYKRK